MTGNGIALAERSASRETQKRQGTFSQQLRGRGTKMGVKNQPQALRRQHPAVSVKIPSAGSGSTNHNFGNNKAAEKADTPEEPPFQKKTTGKKEARLSYSNARRIANGKYWV